MLNPNGDFVQELQRNNHSNFKSILPENFKEKVSETDSIENRNKQRKKGKLLQYRFQNFTEIGTGRPYLAEHFELC